MLCVSVLCLVLHMFHMKVFCVTCIAYFVLSSYNTDTTPFVTICHSPVSTVLYKICGTTPYHLFLHRVLFNFITLNVYQLPTSPVLYILCIRVLCHL